MDHLDHVGCAAPQARLAGPAHVDHVDHVASNSARSRIRETQDRLAHVERVGPSKQRGLEWQDYVAPIIEAG